jgi:hypothetical protein
MIEHKTHKKQYWSSYCNTLSKGEYSAYFRAWNETECNGFTNKQGELFKYDCNHFNPMGFNANSLLSVLTINAQNKPNSKFAVKLARIPKGETYHYLAGYICECEQGQREYKTIATFHYNSQWRFHEYFEYLGKQKIA